MKKLVAIMLIICLVLTISSCGKDNKIIPNESEIESENEQEKQEKNEEIEQEIEQEEYIENTDEQRENEPRDYINGFPLYIEFEEDFVDTEPENRFYHIIGGRTIAIAYTGELYKLEMYRIRYNPLTESNYILGEKTVNIYMGHQETSFVFYSTIGTWWNEPSRALVLIDNELNRHSFWLGIDRESGELIIEKADIPKPRHGNQTFIDMIGTETVAVRIFYYDWENFPGYNVFDKESYAYTERTINVNNFVDEFVEFMKIVDDMWFEGKTLRVDLGAYSFGTWNSDFGTSGSMNIKMSLLMTLASIPNVERIDISIDGSRDAGGAHFDLTPIFDANYYR